MPFALAAALPTASVTAYQAIETTRLKEGHVILINGASGGVGQSAVQFAARTDARILATGTPDLADHLRDLGAHSVIDFTVAPAHEQVAAAHPEGLDAVLDLVTPARPGGIIPDDGPAATPQVAGINPLELLRAGIRLATVRQMKDRAGRVGGRGVAAALRRLADETPAGIHLVGHSYGGRVVLSAVCNGPGPGRPVSSVLLLQLALSAFAFASGVDGRPGGTGRPSAASRYGQQRTRAREGA